MARLYFWGGWHNMPEAYCILNDKIAQDIVDGKKLIYNALTAYQFARIDKYMCGMKDCLCGSDIYTAEMTIVLNGKTYIPGLWIDKPWILEK